jgi:hypothetical protein
MGKKFFKTRLAAKKKKKNLDWQWQHFKGRGLNEETKEWNYTTQRHLAKSQ